MHSCCWVADVLLRNKGACVSYGIGKARGSWTACVTVCDLAADVVKPYGSHDRWHMQVAPVLLGHGRALMPYQLKTKHAISQKLSPFTLSSKLE